MLACENSQERNKPSPHSHTVNLPTNGAAIYVKLWTAYPGGSLLSNSYTYTEAP